MQVQKNVSLQPFNTFGIDACAAYYTELKNEANLEEIVADTALPQERLVLGGGSNILFTRNVDGLVIRNKLKGIQKTAEDETHVWLNVMAGEVWHEFVMYAVSKDLGGIENLSLIPGCVGASPMQNIGAYGVEVKDVIEKVIAWHWEEKRLIELSNDACRFGYRDSIFKQELKNKTLIVSVVFRLDKVHHLHTSYGAIQKQLESWNVQQPGIKDVSDAVIAIRRSKLPDPAKIGNAGSFFKNPTISTTLFEQIRERHPDVPSYPVDDTTVKLPAGWLIEQCGWKGYREGNAGVHQHQALVLVNYGGAKGSDIWALSGKILQSVQERFGLLLEREVQVW